MAFVREIGRNGVPINQIDKKKGYQWHPYK